MKVCRHLVAHAVHIALSFALQWPAAALTLYISPDGSDANDGLTPKAALQTLERAQEVFELHTRGAPQDVEILVEPGLYRGQSVVWTHVVPGHDIRISGKVRDGRSTEFDGGNSGTTFFRLENRGQQSRITIENLVIRDYVMAILFYGNRNEKAEFNGHNRIVGNVFIDVGGTANPLGRTAVAVIDIINSDNNVIESNTFYGMLANECSHLHAIYIAHDSDDNMIRGNRFIRGCGDPIRIRDQSDRNTIVDNVSIEAGDRAMVSEWFCSDVSRSGCTKRASECPSRDNRVLRNQVSEGYRGDVVPEVLVYDFPASPTCPTYR